MAYSNQWRTTVPSRQVPTDNFDDHIRRLRLDVQERMQTFLGDAGDWTTDPVVDTAQVRYINRHWSAFENKGTGGAALGQWGTLYSSAACDESSGALQHVTTSTDVYIYTRIDGYLRGAVLDDIHLTCSTGANTTIDWAVWVVTTGTNPASVNITNSGTVAANTAFGHVALVSGAAYTTLDDSNRDFYALQLISKHTLTAGGDSKIYGVRVKYKVVGTSHV